MLAVIFDVIDRNDDNMMIIKQEINRTFLVLRVKLSVLDWKNLLFDPRRFPACFNNLENSSLIYLPEKIERK
jgi:hypothetical protein